MNRFNHIMGIILIILGSFLLFCVLAPLLIPTIIILFSLWLINYGMRLRGMPPLVWTIKTWWISFRGF